MLKKTFTHVLLLSIFALSSFAQISNPDFEDWTRTANNKDSAYAWSSTNVAVNNITSVITTHTQSSSPQKGMSAAEIITAPFGFAQTPVIGIMVNGKAKLNFDAVRTSYISGGGSPVTSNPTALEGYYKINGSYDGLVTVLMSKYNSSTNKRDTLALNSLTLSATAASYTAFSVPITYIVPNTTADSITVVFYASDPTVVPGVNCLFSSLRVDNLSLKSSVVDGSISRISGVKANDTINNAFTVEAWIKNVGTVDLLNFDLSYEVNGGPAVSETYSGTILAGDSAKHTFSQSWTPSTSGNYDLCIYLNGILNDVSALNDTACLALRSTLGIAKQQLPSISLFPNPASDVLNVEIDHPVQYAVLESSGKIILQGQADENFKLSTSILSSGIYFLQLFNAQSGEILNTLPFYVKH